ncbi:hypothetical protein CRUP_015174 [Coryphaenoides rupestris]|nr:hypothetical protein CRUP_015174 [Coryphaenoides rupestris]
MPRAFRMFILHMGQVRWSSSQGSTQLLWNTSAAEAVPDSSAQDLSGRGEGPGEPSSSDRPVSTAMTREATEAQLAIGWSSPGTGSREDTLNLGPQRTPQHQIVVQRQLIHTVGIQLHTETEDIRTQCPRRLGERRVS